LIIHEDGTKCQRQCPLVRASGISRSSVWTTYTFVLHNVGNDLEKEDKMSTIIHTRRDFLKDSLVFGAGALVAGPLAKLAPSMDMPARMRFGLVTYQWGRDWDLPTVIANCEKARVPGVELRTEHAHGVESNLTAAQRRDVKKRFDDSPVILVGLGTNFAFHYAEKDRLAKDMEGAKAYVRLSHDCGGSGVKVKPNDLPRNVPQEKTIEQIGRSLNELGRYAVDYGQKIRLEVHGGCSRLPIIKAIMDVATHPNVGVCWNCNEQDLEGQGLVYNFNLVKDRFGDTCHVRELNIGDYPYQELMDLFVGMDYKGWILLEARTNPPDRVAALAEQRKVFEQMVAKAKASVGSSASSGVKIDQVGDKLRVEINGKLFTEYNYKDVPRPYFYPVYGPDGELVVRNWPMKDTNPDEAKDHVHHKSLWFTHGEINGQDFWGEGAANSGKIVHDKFLKIKSGAKMGEIVSTDKYVAKDGTVVCTDTRTEKFYDTPDGRIMDWEITIHASNGKVTMGDTKEGSMAIRLTPTMRLKGKVGKGHIINSAGDTDGSTWGKRAEWCDYYGPVDGHTVGVAIFDHPDNPRHPTWWHVRDYGLFAANPFGVHYFEKKPAGTGDLVIPAGQSVTFKYRLYFHEGDDKQAKVAEHYREYAATK
jgi:sugar phosphate isomerase/epimerase